MCFGEGFGYCWGEKDNKASGITSKFQGPIASQSSPRVGWLWQKPNGPQSLNIYYISEKVLVIGYTTVNKRKTSCIYGDYILVGRQR